LIELIGAVQEGIGLPDNPGPVAIYYYHYDADGDNLATSGDVLFVYHIWQGYTTVIWVP